MRFFSNWIIVLILLLRAAAGFSQQNNANGERTLNMYQGSILNLRANSLNAFAYQWFRDGNMIQDAVNDVYQASETGSYTVISFNRRNCSSEMSAPVEIIVWPKSNLQADLIIAKSADEKAVLLNEPFWYTINVENKGPDAATRVVVTDELPSSLELVDMPAADRVATSYSISQRTAVWELPSLNSGDTKELRLSVKAVETGAVTNLAHVRSDVTDPNPDNNTATHVKNIYGIKLANVFTPNSDGVNETYVIPGLENYAENEFTVMNRWGNHVYETKGYKNDWSGDGLNEGTYFYVLKIKVGEKWEAFKGFITLIRNKR